MLNTDPTFEHLYQRFPNSPDRPAAAEVRPEEMPEPYRTLLAHSDHMTVTVERHYGAPVDVRVLDAQRNGNEYARKILLALKQPGAKVVQFGLVRIDLSACSDAVRDAIVEGKTPLGRILIEHDMLRRVEPVAFLRLALSDEMAGWFGVAAGTETYGRLGVIYTGERPVVEVLEILAPVESGQ